MVVRDDRIRTVAAEIRALHRKHALRFAYEVGRLITHEFFAGDAAVIHRRGPKPASLQALADEPDMPLSLPQLSRSVAIYEVLERVGGDLDTWQHLSKSHVRAVLPLAADEQTELLTRAEADRWSVRELQTHAKEIQGPPRPGGRPRLPRFVKSVRALRSYVEQSDEHFADLDAVAKLDAREVAELRETVDEMVRRLEEVRARLG